MHPADPPSDTAAGPGGASGPSGPPRLQVRALTFTGFGRVLFDRLDLDLGPGLHWVIGDEGRGKTTLLGLLSGRIVPTSGEVHRRFDGPLHADHPLGAEDDGTVARAWLAARRQARPATWRMDLQARAAEAFGLLPHLDKPLYQLSTGSRRKVGLVAALACGAPAVALDQPFAALDAASCRVLEDALCDVARATDRLWVVADYAPAGRCPADSVVDLDRLQA